MLIFVLPQSYQHCQKSSKYSDKLDVDAFCKGFEEIILSKEETRTCILIPTSAMFDAIDTNHDGYIQQEEYVHHFKISGLDTSLAKEAFDAIDTNKDGLLSREEFVSAVLMFYNSNEDTPSKYVFGPLVE